MAGSARILLVDDEPEILEAMQWSLAGAGFEVVTADSGAAAIAAAEAGGFAVVVSDYRMPGLDGCRTIATIKQRDPSVRAILATGFDTPEAAADYARSGVDGVLHKPFDLAALIHAVRAVL